jgi:predicted nucleic acid-binding protein
MIFVDSNVWCYYFDKRLSEHKSVVEFMRKIVISEQIVCNTIVVMEVAHYLVRHFTKDVACRKIEHFVNLRNMIIVDCNRQIMLQTLEDLLEYAYTHGLGGRDATIIATIKSLDAKKIVSHNDIFNRLANRLKLEVLDPVQVKDT